MRKPDRAKEATPQCSAAPRPTEAPRDAGRKVLLTYEDYCRTPDGVRYELVEGDLRMTPSPSVSHQEVSKRLIMLLVERLERRGKGKVHHAPCDVVLSQHNVLQPDLLFVSKERLGILGKAAIEGPPDLVVEILSESTERWDRVTKRSVYARFGVRELWLVDPEAKTIEVASLVTSGGEPELATVGLYPAGTMARSPLVPEFEVNVSELFAE